MTKSTENGREIPIMKCFHKIINSSSADLSFIPDGSVQLIVTSPPYPMIEMGRNLFAQNPKSGKISKEKTIPQLIVKCTTF